MAYSKPQKIISHIAGWLLFFSLPLLFLSAGAGSNLNIGPFLSVNFVLFFCCYCFVFYVNTYLLVPKLYQVKKYWLYGLSLAFLLATVALIRPFDRLMVHRGNGRPEMTGKTQPPPHPQGPHPFEPRFPQDGPPPGDGPDNDRSGLNIDAVSIFLFIVVIAFSLAITTSQQLRETEKRVVQAEADKANAELSFLKAQINPHFLFNTLNNIYTLSVRGNENTSESILKLSNIMRYITDEVEADFVSLESEVACLRDYIDLQRLRLSKQTKVDFTVEGTTTQIDIPPLILMTFVENAFKYGVSNHSPSTISINLQVKEHSVLFTCENRIFDRKEAEARIGIGLKNSVQRLNFLYPGRHLLTTRHNDGKFVVDLVLNS